MNRNITCVVAVYLAAAFLCVGCTAPATQVRRFGQVIGIKKDKIDEYTRLHAETWPGVLERIKKCHIRNYSIYLGEVAPDQYYLFAYFEYTGDDFEKDMAQMKADPITQKWWVLTDPLQEPVPTRRPDEWWHVMAEVFHTD